MADDKRAGFDVDERAHQLLKGPLTEAVLAAALQRAYDAGRRSGVEEAASAVERNFPYAHGSANCANEIRALLGGKEGS